MLREAGASDKFVINSVNFIWWLDSKSPRTFSFPFHTDSAIAEWWYTRGVRLANSRVSLAVLEVWIQRKSYSNFSQVFTHTGNSPSKSKPQCILFSIASSRTIVHYGSSSLTHCTVHISLSSLTIILNLLYSPRQEHYLKFINWLALIFKIILLCFWRHVSPY